MKFIIRGKNKIVLLSKKHIHVDVGSGIGIDADTHWMIARIDDGDGDGLNWEVIAKY